MTTGWIVSDGVWQDEETGEIVHVEIPFGKTPDEYISEQIALCERRRDFQEGVCAGLPFR